VKKFVIAALMVPVMAHAEFMNGNDLMNKMQSDEFVPRAVALGYVQGIVDAFSRTVVCVPEHVTAGQVRDLVKSFLETNPAIRHFSADSLALEAISRVWGCKKKGTKL